MALVGVVLIALLGFAVFFLSFLVAPMAILMIFFVGFSASDRAKRNGTSTRLATEAEARRHVIERIEERDQDPPGPAAPPSAQPPAPQPAATLSRAGA